MALFKIAARAAGIVAGCGVLIFTAVQFGNFELRRLQSEVDELEKQRAEMRSYIQRLVADRRVAQIDVIRQQPDQEGHLVTEILWQEIGPDGTRGTPAPIQVLGNQVYFEGMVIKFAHQHVIEGAPERGQSIVLFRRVFGDRQTPDSGFELDETLRPFEETSGESTTEPHQERLWSMFWELVDDPRLAAQYGVRVAQVEAPAARLKPGQIWELTLDAPGGLNLKKIGQTSS